MIHSGVLRIFGTANTDSIATTVATMMTSEVNNLESNVIMFKTTTSLWCSTISQQLGVTG